jgi:3-phosphoshikimate 1-carboxyvinyltransferase
MQLHYKPPTVTLTVQLPASKSISNRVLLIAALCKQTIAITNVSKAADTIALQEMLNSKLMIRNANEAGTAFRFMTAYLCLQPIGNVAIITGASRLRQRPIADLVNALRELGADIEYMDQENFAPLKISGVANLQSEVKINASISSQFVSALCMIAPCLPNGLTIDLIGEATSAPYIQMTIKLMQHFGVQSMFAINKIIIAPQHYTAVPITIDADWSSATFFYCAMLILQNREIHIAQLAQNGLQGDEVIAQICATHFGLQSQTINDQMHLFFVNDAPQNVQQHFDLRDCPDLAIPLIVACALRHPSVTISGLHTLLVKESNRIEALQTELAKIGLLLHYQNDKLRFDGTINTATSVTFETYNDHRIAMALALVAFIHPNISMNDKDVVQKSFPDFWDEIEKLGIKIN